MAVQGRRLDEGQIKRITQLLAETDMSIAEIAERMQCSRSAVATIKRKWRVRGERCETSIQPGERLAPPRMSSLHVPGQQLPTRRADEWAYTPTSQVDLHIPLAT